MSDAILVTGAFGLVGSATVKRLATDGYRVIATARNSPANRKKANSLPAGVEVRWADLTKPADVDELVSGVSPTAIIHLAAVIPPATYRDATFARKVNVDGTASLVRATEDLSDPPRFVHASSSGVYGARNPHRSAGLCSADTPLAPCDLYGGHKLEAEEVVRSSPLEWVILRLGGVFTVDPAEENFDADIVFFGSSLPTDGRVHSVDVRDVAAAFAGATTADVIGQTLLVAGDESHHLTSRDTVEGPAAARRLAGIADAQMGRPGDPDSDDDWFLNCWMDTARTQELLSFQQHSWPDMLEEMRAITGWKRYPTRLLGPAARRMVKRQAAYRNWPGRYADPWGAFRARYGEPRMDTPRAPGYVGGA
jgi:nucleoside-diphosphate-sugar epimerase